MGLSGRLGLHRQVLKIHANPITKHGDIDYEAICKLTDNFNNADMRNICTEAPAFAGVSRGALGFASAMFRPECLRSAPRGTTS